MYIPSILVETYIVYAKEKGINLETYTSQLTLNNAHTDPVQYLNLIQIIQEQLPTLDIGFEIGWRLTPQLFEPLGTAIISAKNLSSALDVAIKYWEIFGFGLCLIVHKTLEKIELEIKTIYLIEKKHESIILKSAIVCLYKIITILIPYHQEKIHLFFKDYMLNKNKIKLSHIHYSADCWKISLPTTLLDEPSFCANEINFKHALVQCELALKINKKNSDTSQELSLNHLAKLQSVSTKTIYRNLKRQGQSLHKLKQNIKYTDAIELLKDPLLSIDHIAIKLGYKDPSNFTRAFKRWTGDSPSNYRKKIF